MNACSRLCIDFSEVKWMDKKRLLPGSLACLGMLILIIDSKAALQAASDGVALCIRTVIPSLFPFFVLSGILVRQWTGRPIPFLRPLGRLLGMGAGTEALLVTGFLGGYPVGAKAVADSWKSGNLSKRDANRLLSFCSNPGPAFLFGMAAPMFSHPGAGWLLWGIQIISALWVGMIFREEPDLPGTVTPTGKLPMTQAVENALSVTAQVCGWVILFRILSTFTQRWFLWWFPDWLDVVFTGFLELTNGCLSLEEIPREDIRFLLCSAMLSWGGFCVVMQTASVINGLSLRNYLLGKFLQTGFCLLFCAVCMGLVHPVCLISGFLPFLLQKVKKRSSNPKAAVV